jgi:hypothetical protein
MGELKRGLFEDFAGCVLKKQNAPLGWAERFGLKWDFWELKTEKQAPRLISGDGGS